MQTLHTSWVVLMLPKQTKKQNRRVQKRWDKYLATTTLTKANFNTCACENYSYCIREVEKVITHHIDKK
jgi:hypothetical protein